MKKVPVLFHCLLIICTFPLSAASSTELGMDKTLSPYFFIEQGETALEQFPLKKTEVQVAISGVIADVTIKQQYANNGGEPINGRYIFPGSTRAAVHGMKMIIGERVITAKIKEKKEAKKIFASAKKQGKSASLLEQQRPNVFSMEVANIMPGDTVEIELRYSELLVPEDSTYEFVYPTVVGPRYSTLPEKGSSPDESWVKNPYLKTGSDPRTDFDIAVTLATGIPVQELACSSHETTIIYDSESFARINLAQDAGFGGDRDYILRYRLAGKQIASGLLLHKGEKENFFLLMVQPPERLIPEQIPSREYIFVVDVSGSMHGFPLNTAKELLEDLIGSLQPTDSFNVLLFAGGSEVMAPTSVPASTEQIRRAVKMINDSNGGGGTELLRAMKKALDLPRQGGVSRTMIVVTDGYINAERDVFETIQKNLDHTNVFAFGIGSSVNRFLIEGIARSGQGEPFVVTGPDEAGAIAEKFRRYVSNPVLTDIEMSFHGLEVYDIEPPAIPDLFAQRPVVLFGKWRGEQSGNIELFGRNGEGEFRRTFSIEDSGPDEANIGLRYLWARSRIARLSDFNPKKGDSEKRSEIVSLGLTYNLLTAFTSFVAVDEVVRNPSGVGKDVKQPLPLPKGVSNLAVSAGMTKTPEPELVTLILLILSLVVIGVVRRRESLTE